MANPCLGTYDRMGDPFHSHSIRCSTGQEALKHNIILIIVSGLSLMHRTVTAVIMSNLRQEVARLELFTLEPVTKTVHNIMQ